jgi:nucleoside-triphosphatase THEP1
MESTEITRLAAQYVNNTNRSIFLTGKAGTGKTTFLKDIVEHTYKNTVVAAPTGIAAINARGVTLHSLFQLPFGPYVPENLAFQEAHSKLNTPQSVVSALQMHKTKRNMIRQMELLIIDEVSMLRADLLDCIDMVLRYVRQKRNIPFGGVQVLFIGDLLQLPPVVKNSEWQWLSKYYKSAFFFEALVLKTQAPINIELNKVYRQSNQEFIDILNHLRNNELTNEDVAVLNRKHNPQFEPKPDDGYIHITTHNKIADSINIQELDKLPGKSQNISAVVKGDFDERIYPVDNILTLKVNSQVMFIKNDVSGERRFFNGKQQKFENKQAKSCDSCDYYCCIEHLAADAGNWEWVLG